MAPPDKSSMAADPKAAIRELVRGREMAARLGALLRGSVCGEGGQDEAGDLAEEVLASFSNAILSLDSRESAEVCQGLSVAAGNSSLCSEDGRSVASTGKRRAQPGGDRRGGQRRRLQSDSWTVPAKTLDDGHSWRKYGQKGIQSATHPRSYFRCTHKHDQGCQAVRQVQKSEEDPSTYIITYMGHHTCMNSAKSAQPGAGVPFLISFGTSDEPVVGTGVRNPQVPAAALADPPPKQECVEEDALSNLSRHDSSSEYFMLPELEALGTSVLLPGAFGAPSDIGDVTSGLHSSCVSPSSLDMDLGVDSFPFEEYMFNLDNDQYDFKFP